MAVDGIVCGPPRHGSPTDLRDLLDRAAGHHSVEWRLRRSAWLGVLLLAALVAYLWGSWRLLDLSDQARPAFVLTGWGLLRDTIRLHGYAHLVRSEEHTSELQSHHDLVCRLLLEKK